MTVYYSTELASIASSPAVKAEALKGHAARLRRYRATLTYATQAYITPDQFVLAIVPTGSTFAFGILTADTSSGSTTIKIGITGTLDKYKAAAAFTATNTPTFFGTAAQAGYATPSSAEETILLTIGTADAPGTGTLVVDLYFTSV